MLSAVFAVVVAIVLVGAILSLASSGDVQTIDEDGLVVLGKTEDLAEQIEKNGPILVPDQSPSGDRDIIIQHLGDDLDEGWVVIAAHPPGEDRDCTLRWKADDGRFEDCNGLTYPVDGGSDLPRYPTRVQDDGRLYVEFPKTDED